MGNQECICCEQAKNSQKNQFPSMLTVTSTARKQELRPPKLSLAITKHLQIHKPFLNELQLMTNRQVKKFGDDIYEGKLNYKNKPQGYGKMYYKNGSIFIGQFENGEANGPGHFVFEDGSYYHGNMTNNKADGNGEYFQEGFYYKGQFKNNMFQGFGQEKSQLCEFKGKYSKNKRTQGLMVWSQNQYDRNGEVKSKKQRTYNGTLNQKGQFHGYGVLTNENGVYKGEFTNNLKNGKGEFEYKTGIKYVGDYKNDIKQGQGTIYSKTGAIAFCGQMKNGLPNGKGYVTNNYGDKVHLTWVNGLDQRLLQSKKDTGSTGTSV